ncbi:hypothetical protein HN937_27515 [Candidatus Poribacteria bacterium]|jgi:hypothetical protein|nr:hypothetical protein [Candidatus Poribacteria bacterium]
MSLLIDVSVGGSGPHAVQGTVFGSMAGFLSDSVQEVKVLLADSDTDGKMLADAKATYRNAYGVYAEAPDADRHEHLLRTRILDPNPMEFNPIPDLDKLTLAKLLDLEMERDARSGVADLVDVLFTTQEQDSQLDDGFVGRPNIGAMYMSEHIDFGAGVWKDFFSHVRGVLEGQDVHIVLKGSTSGGMGTSGLPRIAAGIKRHMAEQDMSSVPVRLAAILYMPYFSHEDAASDGSLVSESSAFLQRAQATLMYYGRHCGELFDAVYVLGSPNGPRYEYSTGGANPPHVVHLASLGAVRHFVDKRNGTNPYHMLWRLDSQRVHWEDLWPDTTMRIRLGTLYRTARAYLDQIYPGVTATSKRGAAAWYQQFLRRTAPFEQYEPIYLIIRECFERYVTWMDDINSKSGDDVRLVRPGAEFERLIQPYKAEETDEVRRALSIQHVMTRLVRKATRREASRAGKGADAIYKFVGFLYDECALDITA